MPGMTEAEARRRFAAARIARLATVDPEGRPRLVPVVFAGGDADPEGEVDREGDGGPEGGGGPKGGQEHPARIVTAVDHKPKRSPRLARLRDIAAHPEVALLVDFYDENWDRLWWVRADGIAHVLPPDAPQERTRAEHAAAIARLRAKYPQYGDQPPDGAVIVIAVHRWTGWCAVAADGPVQGPERPGHTR
ncbi:TIGR03668 family PPOX class F420-dependent oxidoreductase [Streptomyces sp. XM83C]|uniref:TIGR03668 family PPOX class F420-dependent oxidoreductase n=1 Tax=Streptomyces sp. XM83C TaxID=2929781 RepID=UPI001FFB8A9B|nr:TIGR03668 family PPOX class F420-dependent oxidoreductase [Streptomyces sp. XM83C]MCK1819318.1 TIGR03668 family PPOX class F420-dependent oxidoreductase [Streptomyces sp. XM83C]